ncbi:MAG: DUF1320 family protein [Thiothrix sp.]|uniref:phage protein Gp36 family protein n=1 Tax=Thiothrix sp. TaxID=1032 RepID=UPI00261FC819|nr:phage protein Gp36 family protein [Thiothrix sp.]MDD5395237.1 DUF1320 family protein [Thiothrix sp.]
MPNFIDTSAVAAALDDNADAIALREAILTLAQAMQGSHDALADQLQTLQTLVPGADGIAGVIREIETALGLRDDQASGISYCTPVGMLRYGAAELAQRSVNADETMVSPDLLRRYITGADMSGDGAQDVENAILSYWSIAQALGESTREIDRYLCSVATVPLVTVPMEIRDICCRIARYRLARYETGKEDESRVYRDYRLDIAYLRDVSTGKAAVNGLNNTSAGNSAFRGYAVIAPTAIYNKGLRG